MSSMDNGEDEVDYGEAEDQNVSAIAFQGSSAYTEEEEMLQEEGYEDLYDDVNVGFFEPSAEISKNKDILDAGEGFGHGFEEEEVPYVGGLSAGSAHYAHQQNVKTENHSSETLEKQVKIFPSTLAKEAASVVHGDDEHKQLGFSRGAEMVSTTRPQETLEGKPNAAASVIIVSINQARPKDEKNHEMAGIYVHASAPLKAKNESDSTRTGLEYKVPPVAIYPPQERGLKGNGIAVAEPLAGSRLVGNEEYHGITTSDNLVAGKMIDCRSYAGDGRASQGGGNRDSVTVAVVNDYPAKHSGQSNGGGGGTMLFVGELQWWTTDAELETALSEFGVLRSLKFYEERASGKSKGYCQVEFDDHSAALACKEGMNGRKFHGRPCLVAFANPRTIMHMGTAQVDKAQAQLRAQQAQVQSRRTMNDGSGNARGASAYQGGDNTRGYGRQTVGVGRGGHGQAVAGRGPTRGRTNVGNKGMSGNGGSVAGVVPYGQGLVGPMGSHPSGMIMQQAMMGQGYDPGYGPQRGAGYGGYVLPGPPFTGMVQPFPSMGPGNLTGVAPHLNPAFFGRNTTTNGMGMIAGNGMDGSPAGLWGDANINGWGADDHDRRGRESSYGDEMGGSDYTYSNELAYEKSRGAKESDRADAEWPERGRHREREGYRDQRERVREGEKDDDWGREKPGRTRNKGRPAAEEEEKEDQRSRTREEDYGKRRRLGAER